MITKQLLKQYKEVIRKDSDTQPEKYYAVPVLKNEGYGRKKCSKCKTYFWSKNDSGVCGEPECEGGYSFINNPAGKKMSFIETWQSFSKFFEKRGYTPIKRYPVAARWRDDTDFVQASIYDFQPHVVSGNSKPPANPLTVPQYCLRFNDVENVGITGRHKTGFVMIGQHAFLPPEQFNQNKYFQDWLEWFTKEIKLKEDEIKLHEKQWGGGGNLGACMEIFSRGLEIGNQVCMMYSTDENGFYPLKLKVLDMGMGQERPCWITSGNSTIYEAIQPDICKKLYRKTGAKPTELFEKFMPLGSLLDINEEEHAGWTQITKALNVDEETLKNEVLPLAGLYSVIDHTQSLLVALTDGVLPSNIGGGYNLRAILRRALSFINEYGWNVSLQEICEMHAEDLKPQYPELAESLDEVNEILGFEEKKYEQSVKKAKGKVTTLLAKNQDFDTNTLITLYESDGITPELVKDAAKKINKTVKLPEDFYAKLAEKHEQVEEKKQDKEAFDVSGVPKTLKKYYEKAAQFNAYILKTIEKEDKKYVILDQTCFYPESGGQDYDTGYIDKFKVTRVLKQEDVILHEMEDWSNKLIRGTMVKCRIDEGRRKQLTIHHTATHIINGAARNVLGNHIWQAGAEKKVDKARLDITHYDTITPEKQKEIEELANRIIDENRPVNKTEMPRNEAEAKYGFRLYQGGAIPTDTIRVVEIPYFDVEACAGTHADNTAEVEIIKILRTKKIQDGIVRIEFVAGKALAEKAEQTLASKGESEKEKWAKEIQALLDKKAELTGHAEAREIPDDTDLMIHLWKEIKKELEALGKNKAVELEKQPIVFIEQPDMRLLQEAGRKRIKENDELFFIGIAPGVVYGISGENCIVNIETLINKAAAIMGGKAGPSQNPNEYKGGGPLKEKSKQAYEEIKRMIK